MSEQSVNPQPEAAAQPRTLRIIQFLVGDFNPISADGVHKTMYNLSRYYAQMGHQVAVFGISDKPAMAVPGIDVRHFAPTRSRLLLRPELRRAIVDWQPDVVHLHSSFTLETAGMAYWLRRQRIPYIETTHGNMSPYVIRKQRYLKLPFKYLVQLPYLNRAAFIHATDNERHARAYGITVPIVTAYNAFDLAALPDQMSDAWFFDRFPQARGKRVFLFLGRLSIYQKGLDKMIRAFHAADLPDCVLALVGPGDDETQAALRQQINELGLTEQVILAGPAYGDEKWSCFAAADVFVHTSRWEGGAFAALESAAVGLPILITPDADATGKFWYADGVIGVQFDEADITRGMREFSQKSDEELRQMGAANRQLVQREFNWQATAHTLADALLRYTQPRQAPGHLPPDAVDQPPPLPAE